MRIKEIKVASGKRTDTTASRISSGGIQHILNLDARCSGSVGPSPISPYPFRSEGGCHGMEARRLLNLQLEGVAFQRKLFWYSRGACAVLGRKIVVWEIVVDCIELSKSIRFIVPKVEPEL